MIGVWFPVNHGEFALVDKGVYEEVTQYKWVIHKKTKHISRKIKDDDDSFTTLDLAQYVIWREQQSYIGEIDHINRDPRDNRRENLRVVSKSENQHNTNPRKGRFKGVHIVKYNGSRKQSIYYYASIRVNGKQMFLGSFENEESAAKAYDAVAKEHFGSNTYLNFREEM